MLHEGDRDDASPLRLRQVSGYSIGNQDFYAAIWDKSAGPTWEAHHGMSSSAYQAKFNQLTGQGYRLANVCVPSGAGGGRKAILAQQLLLASIQWAPRATPPAARRAAMLLG